MTLALSAIVLSDAELDRFLDDVRTCERLGLRTAWTYDHLTWPALQDGPWYAAVPLLAAAAVATTDIRIGTQVATPNYRHPVPFAKELMTLDRLSGGRLELGVGAGAEGPDAAVLGDPPRDLRERGARFAEWVALLDRLLCDPVTTVHGDRYTAVEARQLPGCIQQPRVPFTTAATGRRALALAARYGQAWVTYGPYGPQLGPQEWFDALSTQSRRLDEALAAVGRPATDLRRIAQLALDVRWPFETAGSYADALARLGELGFDEVTVHWMRPDGRGVPADAVPHLLRAHGLD